ncbi:hypothetical protein N0V90_001753 [Kalmusia sp. IMI 367209]|nr:hypothetical protein N0V90_001753 [Kalmusia sp. IMI 367209]
MGMSLVGQLLHLCIQKIVQIDVNCGLKSLISEEDTVVGAVVTKDGKEQVVKARKGVILAAGGFARNIELRNLYQTFDLGAAAKSLTSPEDKGDAITAAMDIGSATELMHEAWWGPTLIDDNGKPYWTQFERALPHSIVVDSQGVPAYLILDSQHRDNFASTGIDDDFHRGQSPYDHFFGEPSYVNPNLGTLSKPPFLGAKLLLGDLGTKGGVLKDEHGRALRDDGSVIKGLYAVGNSSASVMGREYIGAGSTLGPAMWLAERALNLHSPDRSRERLNGSTTPSRRRRPGLAIDKEPHHVEDEEAPLGFSRMREVQQVFTKARDMSVRIADVFASSDLQREPNSSVEKLHREAVRLSEFELPSSHVIGVIGDSGVGKSSLINSLLDAKDLARASGSACTCVATEYHYHERDDYIIQVEYFTLEELKKQYQEMIRDYQENESPPSDATEEHLQDLQRKARLAKKTLRASFGKRMKQTPSVFTFQIDHAVDTMLQWASQLLPRDRVGQSIQTRETHSTLSTCSSRLRELISEDKVAETNRVEQTCPWPFLRKLKVYLKAYILSKGLIVADLPGLRDANTARQYITERYILQCHQILAVTSIERAITNQSVQDVFQLARRARLSNVHIEIQIDEAMNDYPSERTVMRAMQNKIETIKRKIASLTEEIQGMYAYVAKLSDEDIRIYGGLQQERWQAE